MPKTDAPPAPYIPFKTFLTAVEALEQGLPDDIDRSVWPTFSYNIQTQTVSAFKFLQLIDDEGHVQDGLRTLVAQKDDRKALVRLFRLALARKPGEKEVEIGLGHLADMQDRGQAFEDILWSLVNTAEFTTKR